jgi:hypothetical protein
MTIQHYKMELQMETQADERLDERVKELFSADLLVAFKHATIFNWPSKYITKDEQYNIARQILAEYKGYELYPSHIYYHVEMYARNKHPNYNLPYPTNAAYKPPKYKIGRLYVDLLDDSMPSETEDVKHAPDCDPGAVEKTDLNTTIYSIWLNSTSGTITGEQLALQEKQINQSMSRTMIRNSLEGIYDDLITPEQPRIVKKSIFGTMPKRAKQSA